MSRGRKRNRPNATRRSDTSRFVRLDYRILRSNGYRSLSPNARSLLVELVMLYNGENNGSLYLSVRDAAHRMGVSDLTAATRAFDDLVALGFIEMTKEAYFRVKAAESSRARCWRLTWLAGPGRKLPNWTLLEREPEAQTQARKRMDRGLRALKAHRKARDQNRLPVLDSDTASPFCPTVPDQPLLDSNTLSGGNDGFPPIAIVRDSATHIASTMGTGRQSSVIGWWQPHWERSTLILAVANALTEQAKMNGADHRRAA